MSSAQGIAERVRATLASTFAVQEDSLTPDTSLYDDIGADSLGIMELMSALEDELGIELPESNEYALGIRTVGDLVEAFASRAP